MPESPGDRLVIPAQEKPAEIDPIVTSTTLSAVLADIVFDGLIRFDLNFEPRPHLARNWTISDDGLTWTFYLRKGVRFHDGSELTAEDVAFTYRILREDREIASRAAYLFDEVDKIKIKERYVLEIVLKRPESAFLDAMDVGIVPKHLYENRYGHKTSTDHRAIGTGPYKLSHWSDREIILKANADYFLGNPRISEIRVVVYPNQKAVWAKLLSGEVDFYNSLTPEDYEILGQVPSFNLYSVPLPYYYMIALNLNNKHFADTKVRQALNYAIDKNRIIDKLLKKQGRAVSGTIYPGSWAYDPNVQSYPYDPRKALRLLRRAGWEDHDGDHFLDKDGRPFEFTVHINSGDSLKKEVYLLIEQQLLDIGIRTRPVMWNAAEPELLFKKRFDGIFVEIAARGNPDLSYKYWHSSQSSGGFNVFSYKNRIVDELLERGRKTSDRENRKAIYSEYQKQFRNDPPGIFLFWTNYLVGVNKRVKGVKVSPVGPFFNIGEWTIDEGPRHS